MSESDETSSVEAEAAEVKLRRRLLGYKRTDVEHALKAREGELDELEGELDAREAEVTELRQDVAALWLAFAQHDRTLEDLRAAVIALADERRAAPPTPAPRPFAPPPSAPRPDPARAPAVPPQPEVPVAPESAAAASAPEASVGRQLADLDDVLAAIEMATQTLEQTYAEEIEASQAASAAEVGWRKLGRRN